MNSHQPTGVGHELAPIATKFIAFLSYKHEAPDSRWADWLHRELESYRVPRVIQRDRGIGPRLGRVFQDSKELAASIGLTTELRGALDDSQFLIVVCSPRSAASKWVSEEVSYFVSKGRRDRVILLMIEGDPERSFPSALIGQDEPLAVDVQGDPAQVGKRDRRDAFLRIVAPMIGCRFDDLRRREQERRQRFLAVMGVACITLALVMTALAGWALIERAQAQKRYKQVYELSQSLIFEIDEAIMDIPGTLEARRLIVPKALAFLNELSPNAGNDVALLNVLAVGYSKVGDIQGGVSAPNIGDTSGALTNYDRAEGFLRKAVSLKPGDRMHRRRLATHLEHRGDLLIELGRNADSARDYRESKSIREEIVRTAVDNRCRALMDLASSQEREGDLLLENKDFNGAIAAYQTTVATRAKALIEPDAKSSDRRDLAISYDKLSNTFRDAKKLREAREAYDSANTEIQRLRKADPHNGPAMRSEGIILRHLGLLALRQGDILQARAFYEASRDVLHARRAIEPKDVEAISDVADATRAIGDIDFEKKAFSEAEKRYAESIELTRDVLRRNPTSTQFRRQLWVGFQYLADAQSHKGEFDTSIKNHRVALSAAEELAAGERPTVAARFDVASCATMLADVLFSASEHPAKMSQSVGLLREAGELYARVASIYGVIDKESPLSPQFRVEVDRLRSRSRDCQERLTKLGEPGGTLKKNF